MLSTYEVRLVSLQLKWFLTREEFVTCFRVVLAYLFTGDVDFTHDVLCIRINAFNLVASTYTDAKTWLALLLHHLPSYAHLHPTLSQPYRQAQDLD